MHYTIDNIAKGTLAILSMVIPPLQLQLVAQSVGVGPASVSAGTSSLSAQEHEPH